MEPLELEDIETDPSVTDLRFVPYAEGLSMGRTDKGNSIAIILRDEDHAPIAFTLANPETIRALLNRCMEVQ